MHAVNDPYFVLLILFCAAVITVGATLTSLSRIPRWAAKEKVSEAVGGGAVSDLRNLPPS
jgi:hypothetical protein